MKIRRLNVIIHGRVQGVAFRYYTRDQGQYLGLKGWVKNLVDGTVATEFEGDEVNVEKMLAWLPAGSPASKVANIEITELEPVGVESGFKIEY